MTAQEFFKLYAGRDVRVVKWESYPGYVGKIGNLFGYAGEQISVLFDPPLDYHPYMSKDLRWFLPHEIEVVIKGKVVPLPLPG